jgi:hypothetical protein
MSQSLAVFKSQLIDIALCWDICQSELPYNIDLCSACSLLTYDWSIDLSIRCTHAQRNIWTLDYWISPFVAVDELILLLWDYYQISRWQTCCLINLNLYIVIYKFAFMPMRSKHDKSKKWAYFVSWCVVGRPSFPLRDCSESILKVHISVLCIDINPVL